MKKFGTPIGAGPGSESENVGLDALGTPLPLGSRGLAVACRRVAFGCPDGLGLGDLVWGWPWCEGFFCGEDGVGCGVARFGVEVLCLPGALEGEREVEVELEVVRVDDEPDVVDELVVVVVVVDDELVVVVVQVIVSEAIPGMLRGGITPGVELTGTRCWPPPTSVTVTVHGSAEAIGMAAVARTMNAAAAKPSTARSLRLMLKPVRPLLRPSRVRLSCVGLSCTRVCAGTLLTGTEVCNLQPPDLWRDHAGGHRAPAAWARTRLVGALRAQFGAFRGGRFAREAGPQGQVQVQGCWIGVH